MTITIYEEHGAKNRREYLQNLAEEYGLDESIVFSIAELYGASEDFDGLICALQDCEALGYNF